MVQTIKEVKKRKIIRGTVLREGNICFRNSAFAAYSVAGESESEGRKERTHIEAVQDDTVQYALRLRVCVTSRSFDLVHEQW